jgi:hypothetical protein
LAIIPPATSYTASTRCAARNFAIQSDARN